MFNSIMMIMFLLPVVAMLNVVTNQSHFLMTLLALEGVTLSLVLFTPFTLNMINAPNTGISVIILTLGACEASLGLSLLVLMSRSYGTDMLNLLTLSKC